MVRTLSVALLCLPQGLLAAKTASKKNPEKQAEESAVQITDREVRLGITDPLPGQLQTLLQEALERNPPLREQRIEVAKVEDKLRIAALSLLPKVSLSVNANAGASRGGQSDATSDPAMNGGATFSMSANMTLFDGGRSWRAIDSARREVIGEGLRLYEAEEDLILSVLDAYYSYLSAREQLDSTEATFRQASGDADLLRRQVQHGLAFRVDLLGMEVQVASAESYLLDAREGVGRARDQLNRILDRPYGLEIELADDFITPVMEVDSDQLRAWTTDNHPTVLQSRMNLIEARQAHSDTLTGFFPSLGLNASLGPETGTRYPAPLVPTGPLSWSVGASLGMTLPDWELYYSYQSSKLSLQSAESGLDGDINTVVQEVSGALLGLSASSRTMRIARMQLGYHQENYQVHKLGFAEGLHSFDVVNRIYNELRQAEVAYFAGIRTHYVTWANLLRAASLAHNLVQGQPRRGPGGASILETMAQ